MRWAPSIATRFFLEGLRAPLSQARARWIGDGEAGGACGFAGVARAGEVVQQGQRAPPDGDRGGDITGERIQLTADRLMALDTAGLVLAELDVPLRRLVLQQRFVS